jgi:hypothetical protein
MLHAADLFRVPGIGLFGPSDPQEFGFRFTRGLHLRGRGTMERIAVSDVILAFDEATNSFGPFKT